MAYLWHWGRVSVVFRSNRIELLCFALWWECEGGSGCWRVVGWGEGNWRVMFLGHIARMFGGERVEGGCIVLGRNVRTLGR